MIKGTEAAAAVHWPAALFGAVLAAATVCAHSWRCRRVPSDQLAQRGGPCLQCVCARLLAIY